jgi:hypothetical protein
MSAWHAKQMAIAKMQIIQYASPRGHARNAPVLRTAKILLTCQLIRFIALKIDASMI